MLLSKQLLTTALLLVVVFLTAPVYSQQTDSIAYWENQIKKESNDSLMLNYYSKLIRATAKADPVKASEYILDATIHVGSIITVYHHSEFALAQTNLISVSPSIMDSILKSRIKVQPTGKLTSDNILYRILYSGNLMYLGELENALKVMLELEPVMQEWSRTPLMNDFQLIMIQLNMMRGRLEIAREEIKSFKISEPDQSRKVCHWIKRYLYIQFYLYLPDYDSLFYYSTIDPDSFPTIYHQGYANALAGIALKNKKQYADALPYANKAREINLQIGNKIEYFRYVQLVADFWLLQNKPETAIDTILPHLEEMNAVDWRESYIGSLLILSNAYKALGDYKKAYEFRKLLAAKQDTLKMENNDRSMSRLFARFDNEKRDREIAFQASLIGKQKITRYIIAGVAVLLLTLMVFVVIGNRRQQRENLELAAARERAESSERFKQQFLANMSHEIRTPMNAVTGMIRLLLEKAPDPKQVKYLEAMQRSADSLLHIINDILDLSKIEAGKVSLEQIGFPLNLLMQQMEDTLRYPAGERRLELAVKTDPNLPELVRGDPGRLLQILLNLGSNAIKFTPSGKVTISAKAREGNAIHFSVTDTGIGIPKEKLDTIFDSFQQANISDTREYGGTGLGLTISKQLTELMGGQLQVESTVGQGTTFHFSILLPPCESSDVNSVEISAESLTIPPGLKILLVDDNEDNRIVARDTLEAKASVGITEAVNGEDALRKVQTHSFDLILMDVQMPVMDGYEAMRQIRQLPAPACYTPVVALTASVIKSDLDKCRDAGMNDYVPKPFNTTQLLNAVRRNAIDKNQKSDSGA